MKTGIYFWLTIFVLLVGRASIVHAQQGGTPFEKKPIDSSIFEATDVRSNTWPKIEFPALSEDGRYVAYILKNFPSPGERKMVFQGIEDHWQQTYTAARYYNLSGDSKWALIGVRQDSINLLRLGTIEIKIIDHLDAYETNWNGNGDWLAYIRTGDSILTLQDLNSGAQRTFGQVNDFHFSSGGTKLLWQSLQEGSTGKKYSLYWMDLLGGAVQKLDEDTARFNLGGLILNSSETAAALVKEGSLWYYKEGKMEADLLAGPSSRELPANMHISPGEVTFGSDGHRLLFKLEEDPLPVVQSNSPGETVQVDVWRYNDNPNQASYYPAMINLDTRSIIYLGAGNRHFDEPDRWQSHPFKYLLYTDATGMGDYWWHKDSLPSFYLVNTSDGISKAIKKNIDYYPDGSHPGYMEFNLSPAEKYVLNYDPLKNAYFSYTIQTGQTHYISRTIHTLLYDKKFVDNTNDPAFQHSAGIIAWLKDDKGVLVYDNYDIWLLDLSGKQDAVNLTGGYGRKHRIAFSIAGKRAGIDVAFDIASDSTLLLMGFDEITKYEGFYKLSLNSPGILKEITKGPYWYSEMTKSGNTWLYYRQSTGEYPNLFATADFKNVHQLTNFQPQKDFNWLTAELVNYTLPDGRPCQGILYKPENFDSTRKYPVIFYYYEKLTQELFQFQQPGVPADIVNIPVFVNKGYLVFLPDIWYKVGSPGDGAVQSVVAAAHLLAQRPYVDARHMGLNGHSWGSYETYYVIAHSHLFAAAVASDGPTDFISNYGIPRGPGGSPAPHMEEMSQCRIGATPWQRLDLYIKNSPVLQADKITTPLLMQHNKKDWLVNFDQGMELFNALRRMDKKVWLLQYDQGSHGTRLRQDMVDYSIRMEQFFDHYLKGAPAPKWMVEGIPARLKGMDKGYELEPGREP
jgi:dipeptidyl aminopeptidase/acylaminoacyl peptidase